MSASLYCELVTTSNGFAILTTIHVRFIFSTPQLTDAYVQQAFNLISDTNNAFIHTKSLTSMRRICTYIRRRVIHAAEVFISIIISRDFPKVGTTETEVVKQGKRWV